MPVMIDTKVFIAGVFFSGPQISKKPKPPGSVISRQRPLPRKRTVALPPIQKVLALPDEHGNIRAKHDPKYAIKHNSLAAQCLNLRRPRNSVPGVLPAYK